MPTISQLVRKGREKVTDCEVEIVWDPPWDPSKMSDEAKLALNMF